MPNIKINFAYIAFVALAVILVVTRQVSIWVVLLIILATADISIDWKA